MAENRPFLAFYERDNSGQFKRVYALERGNEVVNAGSESATIVLYAKNITMHELINISIMADDEDVVISPSKIQSLGVGRMIEVAFTWKPKLRRRTALSTKIRSVATEVIRPR